MLVKKETKALRNQSHNHEMAEPNLFVLDFNVVF